MGIPKVIHYCWFGNQPLPSKLKTYIKSWKKFCPDYTIIQWNENNFDLSSNRYAYEAWCTGKWAFVSDYARLKIIYEQGGIYLDTDVELIRPLDSLLKYNGFIGFQADGQAATGLGFGAVKGHPVILALLKEYDDIPFLQENGRPDTTPCPLRNTAALRKLGFDCNPNIIQQIDNFYLFPPEFFCPKDFKTYKMRRTANTYSIHHYRASWRTPEQLAYDRHLRRTTKLEKLLGPRIFHSVKYLWHRLHGKPQ